MNHAILTLCSVQQSNVEELVSLFCHLIDWCVRRPIGRSFRTPIILPRLLRARQYNKCRFLLFFPSVIPQGSFYVKGQGITDDSLHLLRWQHELSKEPIRSWQGLLKKSRKSYFILRAQVLV